MNIPNPFIAVARSGRNGLWRYIVTLMLSLALLLFGSALLGAVFFGIAAGGPSALPPWLMLVVSLAPFGLLIVGVWLGLRFIHQRPFFTLLNPAGYFRWRLFGVSAGVWLVLSAIGDGVLALIYAGSYHFVYEPARFWPYALAAVVLLPVQVAAEELWFRGYLTQGFGLAGGYWAGWLVPAFLFGLLHGFNPEVGAYGLLLTMPVYIGLGLVLGWVTLRTAGLEMSLGLHLANNLYATLLVTTPVSALPAPALFRILHYQPEASLIVFAVMSVLYLAFIFKRSQ